MSDQGSVNETALTSGHDALSEALRSSFRMLRWFMIVLIIGYVFSGLFVVQQHEKAFVLLYGKIHGQGDQRIKGPGIHWSLPRPFSEVVRVPTRRSQEVASDAFWFELKEVDGEEKAVNSGGTLRPGLDGYALSGDANIVHSRWAFQYVVSDPEAYYFSHQEPDAVLVQLFDRAVVHAFARAPMEESLRENVGGLIAEVEGEFKQQALELGLGVEVESVKVLNIIPPLQVFGMMNDVYQQESNAGTQLAEARKYAEGVVTGAAGEAERIVRQAETAKQDMLSEIQADVAYFEKIAPQFAKNPEVMRHALLNDSIKRALSDVKELKLLPTQGRGQRTVVIDAGREFSLPGSNPTGGGE